MAIEVILFDAAGTLMQLPRGVGFHYADVAARHGVVLNPETIDQVFSRVWRSTPSRKRSKGPRVDDDRQWWQRLVYQVLDGLNAPDFDRAAYFDELYDEFTKPGVWELFPEVRDVLTALAPRVRLGIVSNFDQRLRPILDGFGLSAVFEHVIVSSEVGADKPDPAIFHYALNRFAISPQSACHVGDDPVVDWLAARNEGLRVYELNRPGNDLRGLLAFLDGEWSTKRALSGAPGE